LPVIGCIVRPTTRRPHFDQNSGVSGVLCPATHPCPAALGRSRTFWRSKTCFTSASGRSSWSVVTCRRCQHSSSSRLWARSRITGSMGSSVRAKTADTISSAAKAVARAPRGHRVKHAEGLRADDDARPCAASPNHDPLALAGRRHTRGPPAGGTSTHPRTSSWRDVDTPEDLQRLRRWV